MLKILIFLFISMPVLANWSLKRDYGNTVIYSAANKTRLTINYGTTVPRKKRMTLNLAKYVEKQKKKMLSFVNIKNWKVTERKFNQRKDHTMIKISGSYISPRDKVIYFTEYHYYKIDRKLQVLLTNTNQEELNKNNSEELLSGFKTQYGI